MRLMEVLLAALADPGRMAHVVSEVGCSWFHDAVLGRPCGNECGSCALFGGDPRLSEVLCAAPGDEVDRAYCGGGSRVLVAGPCRECAMFKMSACDYKGHPVVEWCSRTQLVVDGTTDTCSRFERRPL